MIKKTKKEIMQDQHLTRPPRLKAKSKNAQIKNAKKKKKETTNKPEIVEQD